MSPTKRGPKTPSDKEGAAAEDGTEGTAPGDEPAPTAESGRAEPKGEPKGEPSGDKSPGRSGVVHPERIWPD